MHKSYHRILDSSSNGDEHWNPRCPSVLRLVFHSWTREGGTALRSWLMMAVRSQFAKNALGEYTSPLLELVTASNDVMVQHILRFSSPNY